MTLQSEQIENLTAQEILNTLQDEARLAGELASLRVVTFYLESGKTIQEYFPYKMDDEKATHWIWLLHALGRNEEAIKLKGCH